MASSYESGHQPFLPDTKRGYWANPNDFIYAGIVLAFCVDQLSFYSLSIIAGDTSLLPCYLLGTVIAVVPLIVLQSLLGQFSSSGFISALRVSPLFKGIGYAILPLNIFVLAYYSIFAIVPMIYMFASMNSNLPWSCENFKTWTMNLTNGEEANLCNISFRYEIAGKELLGYYDNKSFPVYHHAPSSLYLIQLFGDKYSLNHDDVEFTMAWQLLICAILLWSMIALVVFKLFDTAKFGALIRYCLWTLISLLVLLLFRFSFFAGAGKAFYRTIVPSSNWYNIFYFNYTTLPIYSISTFGPGWGLFITLASYNKFKTNIIKSSWLISLGQFFITVGLSLLMQFTNSYLYVITDEQHYKMDSIWKVYLASGSAMVHMEWANMWSVLFFFMLFLAAFALMLIQLNSILRSIFDEFVLLREKKLHVAISLIGFLAVCSFYLISNHGTRYFTALIYDTAHAKVAIYLLLLLVMVWIYGRVRFQRDIEFITGQRYSSWMVYVLRFLTPPVLLSLLQYVGDDMEFHHRTTYALIDFIVILFIAVPWIFIPGYIAYNMYFGMGPIKIRFLRCCRPNDWFPVELEHRQKYEAAVASPEITLTMNEIQDQEIVEIYQ